ncbi:MAG: hypothetical protein JOZ81_29825, partial [Chloroflexi bacterium]|nr:hypothetical protein [Chloroflexota bacterium]
MSPTTTPTHDSSHSHPWYTRPFRIFQTNIREVDAGMDVDAVAEDVR